MVKDSTAEINKLKKELARAQLENRELKRQTSSKRFRAAWRLADTFNALLPVNSSRRKVVISTGKTTLRIYESYQDVRVRGYQETIINMVGDKPVIIYDSIPWKVELKQRPQHLAAHLSQAGYFIIYLERTGEKPFRVVNSSMVTIKKLATLKNLVFKNKLYFFVSSTNANQTIYSQVKDMFGSKMQLIYEYIDEISGDISPMAHELQDFYDTLHIHEPALILASAKKLLQDLVGDGFSKKKILLSENAVNIEDFDYTQKQPVLPLDLARVKKDNRPIIGYYGALAPWLNAELMNNLAHERKDLAFVYIGPDYGGGSQKFQKYPNTHFLGPKDYQELPNYALFFDCAIVPFQYGEIAKSTSPVKLFEYMAMGLPTVGTRDLRELEGYKYVHVSEDAANFEKNLDRAIKEKQNSAARKTLLEQAKLNTWEQRAKDIIKFLNNDNKRSKK